MFVQNKIPMKNVLFYVGIPVFGGAIGAILYILLTKNRPKKSIKPPATRSSTLTIPILRVGNVIGAGGSTINNIQNKTGARVKVKNASNDDSYATCQIFGTEIQRRAAECMIYNLISDDQNCVEEMSIPSSLVRYIIGKNGETIRHIRNVSDAKIKIENDVPDIKHLTKITVRGNKSQINTAMLEINRVVHRHKAKAVEPESWDQKAEVNNEVELEYKKENDETVEVIETLKYEEMHAENNVNGFYEDDLKPGKEIIEELEHEQKMIQDFGVKQNLLEIKE